MYRSLIVSALLSGAGVISAYATDLAAIIQKVSENCDKIESFTADAEMRYWK